MAKLNLDFKTYQTRELVGLYMALTAAYVALPESMWSLRKLLSPALIFLLIAIAIDVVISLAKPKTSRR